jgi:Bacterial transcriptional activator domain
MDYRILGSFEVRVDGQVVAVGGEKPRALLVLLLLHRNEVVSAERLIDGLWGETPPASALGTLRAYVSRVRKAFDGQAESISGERDSAAVSPDGRLLTRGHGYLLRVAPGELDLERFCELADRGRETLAAGRAKEASRVLGEALELWRGPPLGDFVYEPFAQATIAQLEELQLAAIEDRIDADLAVGRARGLVGVYRRRGSLAAVPADARIRRVGRVRACFRFGDQAQLRDGRLLAVRPTASKRPEAWKQKSDRIELAASFSGREESGLFRVFRGCHALPLGLTLRDPGLLWGGGGVAGRKTAAAKRGEAGSADPSAGVARYRQPSPQACTTPCGRVRLGIIRISGRGVHTA